MKHVYGVFPGREIRKDGKPFIFVTRNDKGDEYVSPTECDTLTRDICDWLNSREENREW